uniref:Uncharacterized protein n=2 Tax=Timema TaxID=61471 RepID=A0A7R9HSH6_9NEOP|nr:unnamed protein product [Timema cristinae]CAD7433541.1 unnamed protein product [Timema monikensis]
MCSEESYRQWVCGSLFPYFPGAGQLRVRPCRTECQRVEQKCPFFLPGDRAPPWDRAPVYPTQYAGEPTFLCLDPNIPETGDQLAKSSYGPQGCCYAHCGNELCHSGCRPNTTAGPTTSQHARHCSATPLTYPDQQRGAGLSACAPTFTMVASGGVATLPARHPPPCWTTVLLKLLFHMCVVVNTLNNSLLHLTARFALVQAILVRPLWESA